MSLLDFISRLMAYDPNAHKFYAQVEGIVFSFCFRLVFHHIKMIFEYEYEYDDAIVIAHCTREEYLRERAEVAVAVDRGKAKQLVEMGFPELRARAALVAKCAVLSLCALCPCVGHEFPPWHVASSIAALFCPPPFAP